MQLIYSKNYSKTAYGFAFERRSITGLVGRRWILIIYFYKWYRAFANFPLNKN